MWIHYLLLLLLVVFVLCAICNCQREGFWADGQVRNWYWRDLYMRPWVLFNRWGPHRWWPRGGWRWRRRFGW